MRIEYRKLSSGDSFKYRKIRLESLRYHPESFGASYEKQKILPRLMFEVALQEPYDGRFVMGAFDGDQIIGICGFVPFSRSQFPGFEKAGDLIQLYVKPKYRRNGIGRTLVEELAEEGFRIPGIDKIILEVKKDNHQAIRIYEKAGFLIFDSGVRNGRLNAADSILMFLRKGT